MSESNAPVTTPGLFGWNELVTSDVEAAKKFYGEMLGWESTTQTMAPGMDYTMFKKDGAMVAGMIGITPQMGPVPPHWLSYVVSGDVAADVAKASAAGARILKDVMEIPKAGTMAVIQDPQGAVFALWKSSESGSCG